MANPFFSGRIPQDLKDRIDQHRAETGESTTDVLIKALSAYVKHPVARPSTDVASSKEDNRLRILEERLAALELLFKEFSSKTFVISSDNCDNSTQPQAFDNFDNSFDNKADNNMLLLEDPWGEDTNLTSDNETDNNIVIKSDSEQKITKLLPEYVPPKFEGLTVGEFVQATGLKHTQLDGHKKRVAAKYQKLGQPLEDKKLLEQPEKIDTRQPITVNGYPYDLFYLGQNEKGNNLWSALPFDNNRYQQLSIQTNSEGNLS